MLGSTILWEIDAGWLTLPERAALFLFLAMMQSTSFVDWEAGRSRVLETLRHHKAPPPLGGALDMRDGHPASKSADRR